MLHGQKKKLNYMDFHALRRKAEAGFKMSGFPDTKQESWRFTDVSPVANRLFSSEWKRADMEFTALDEIVVVFENGRFLPEKSVLDNLPSGVRVGSVLDWADSRLGTLAGLQNGFISSNTAYFSDGAFIEIPDETEVDRPIHLIYLADLEGAAIHVRNFISVGSGAKVTVVEEYIGCHGIVYWSNVVTEMFIDDRAVADHYKVQRESNSAYHFQTVEAQIGIKADFSNHTLNIGSVLGRNDIRGKLVGEDGGAVCNGLTLLKGRQLFDTHLFLDHAVPKCYSRELYKSILDDKARSVFCGRILVRPDAQQTDAIQSNRSLLLTRTAKINTLPQLEIYANDVKCTHGATVGQLDEATLHYLQTRGITPEESHAMLIAAFANEMLDEIRCKTTKAYIKELIHEWIGEASA